MNDLERLIAIEEIKQTKARYFRAIDTKSFDELRRVFAEDAVFDFQEAIFDPIAGRPDGVEPTPPVHGQQAIIDAVSAALIGVQSVHHGHQAEIEFVSDTQAKAIFPMEDVILSAATAFRGYGYYVESYTRTSDGWRIQHSRISRLRIVLEQSTNAPSPRYGTPAEPSRTSL